MPPRSPPLLLVLLLALGAGAPARALGLAPLPPVLPSLGAPQELADPLLREGRALTEARLRQAEALLRRHPDALQRDPAGAPVVRGELLAIDPTPAALDAIRAAGFRVREPPGLAPLSLRVFVLEPPPRRPLARALRQLRRLDPGGSYDYNHLYLAAAPAVSGAPGPVPAAASADGPLVGLVDGGVDRAHPAFAGRELRTHGCPEAAPDPHGTAVASLLLAEPRLRLRAADIYCGQATGGAVLRLAEALAWLSQEGSTVINISLVGPPNALLERLVADLQARGHVLVAAVGNDGPAAPPLYPAAYAGVIGVAALDARGRPLPESGRGAQVDFAASGLFAWTPREGAPMQWRGTSFAAPRVARRAALAVPAPMPEAAAAAMAALAAQAREAGPAGRDPRYGLGVLDDAPEAAR